MKKFSLYVLLFSLNFLSSALFAQPQTACPGVTAPEVQNAVNSYEIGATIWTPAPTLATPAVGLTNVEYLIVKVGTCALDSARVACDPTAGGGDVIIGSDADGIFDPGTLNRYGVTIQPGDTFGIVAVGYNLAQVKGLLNKIITGTITGSGAPCCFIFNLQPATAGFCDTLANAGINGQDDINDLGDVLDVFDAFTDAQLSVNALASYMLEVNNQAGLLSSVGCADTTTSGDIICYGMNPNAVYKYVAASNVSVNMTPAVASVEMFPNPANTEVTLQISTETATEITVNVYNSIGVKVSTDNLGVVNGNFTLRKSTDNLASGMYLVELTNGKKSQTQKLIIR
jgi:hypothetical protein